MKIKIFINLKPEILDPQGEAIAKSLKTIGFSGINSLRQGKVIEIDLEETDSERAIILGKEMCHKLLANSVMEDFSITIE